MQQRVNISTTIPQAWKAMYALSGVTASLGLAESYSHLIRIRASQINSCAFCINMHTQEALKSGESQQRIFLLGAWRETDLFSDAEKAVLALTEEVTLIHQHGLSDDAYTQAQQFFNADTIAAIIMAVVTINAWNRIAVSTHLPVDKI